MGHCTSLAARPQLQAGISSSWPPLSGAGSPAAIIYTRRYQFLPVCSREVCVNCCCCGSSLSHGHQFLRGSSRRTGLSDFLQGWVKVVEWVLSIAGAYRSFCPETGDAHGLFLLGQAGGFTCPALLMPTEGIHVLDPRRTVNPNS